MMLVHDVFDSNRPILAGWKQAGVSAEETKKNGPCWTRNSYFKARPLHCALGKHCPTFVQIMKSELVRCVDACAHTTAAALLHESEYLKRELSFNREKAHSPSCPLLLLPNCSTFWSSFLKTTRAVELAASRNLADVREGQVVGASTVRLGGCCEVSGSKLGPTCEELAKH
ncbi:hypothetical protein INR49_026072 [Caranx melampygus]|nr:hypothetical protein INR49_026072 [Caranx melampygus]